MKALLRNKVPFWYCSFARKEDLKDDSGYVTGDYRIIYSDPVKIKGNVSPARGNVQSEMFGGNLQYDKVIVLDDPDCPIDESSVLFIDKEPEFNDDGDPLFDYIVKRAARSINGVSYAVLKAAVS